MDNDLMATLSTLAVIVVSPRIDGAVFGNNDRMIIATLYFSGTLVNESVDQNRSKLDDLVIDLTDTKLTVSVGAHGIDDILGSDKDGVILAAGHSHNGYIERAITGHRMDAVLILLSRA